MCLNTDSPVFSRRVSTPYTNSNPTEPSQARQQPEVDLTGDDTPPPPPPQVPPPPPPAQQAPPTQLRGRPASNPSVPSFSLGNFGAQQRQSSTSVGHNPLENLAPPPSRRGPGPTFSSCADSLRYDQQQHAFAAQSTSNRPASLIIPRGQAKVVTAKQFQHRVQNEQQQSARAWTDNGQSYEQQAQNRPAAPRNSYPQSKSTYQPPPPSHSSYNRRHSQNYNNQIHHSPSTSFAPVQQSYPQPYQAPLPPQYGDGNGNGPPLPPDFIPPPENTQSHFPAAYQRDISLHSHRQSQALERRPSISNSNYNPNYDSNSRTASYPTFPDSVPNQPSSYAQAQSQSRPRADSRSHPHPAEQAHPSRSQQHDNEQRRPRSPAYSPPLEVTRVPSYAQQQQQKQQYDDDDMSRRGVPFTVTDPSLGRDGNTGSSAGGGFGKSRKSAGPGLGAGGAGWGHNFNDDEPSSLGRGGGGGRAHQAAAPAKAPETKGRNKPPPGFGGLNAIFNQAISSSVSTSNKPGTGKGKGATRRIQQEEEDGEQNGADDYQAREQMVKALPSFKKPSRAPNDTSTSAPTNTFYAASSSSHQPVASSSRQPLSIAQDSAPSQRELDGRRAQAEVAAEQQQKRQRKPAAPKAQPGLTVKGSAKGKGKGKGRAPEIIELLSSEEEADDDDDDDEEGDGGSASPRPPRRADDEVDEIGGFSDEEHSGGKRDGKNGGGGGGRVPRASSSRPHRPRLPLEDDGDGLDSDDILAMDSTQRPPELRSAKEMARKASQMAKDMLVVPEGNTANIRGRFESGENGNGKGKKTVTGSMQGKSSRTSGGGYQADGAHASGFFDGNRPPAAKQTVKDSKTAKGGKAGKKVPIYDIPILPPMLARNGIPACKSEAQYRLVLNVRSADLKSQTITIRRRRPNRDIEDLFEFKIKDVETSSTACAAEPIHQKPYFEFTFGMHKQKDWEKLLKLSEADPFTNKSLFIFFSNSLPIDSSSTSDEQVVFDEICTKWNVQGLDSATRSHTVAAVFYEFSSTNLANRLQNESNGGPRTSRAGSAAQERQGRLNFGPASTSNSRPLQLDADGDLIETATRKSSRPSNSALANPENQARKRLLDGHDGLTSNNVDVSSDVTFEEDSRGSWRAPQQDPYPSDQVVLEYPLERKAGETSVSLTYGDVKRLGEDEFLNDTLIEFGLKTIFHEVENKDESLAPDVRLAPKIHIFNSFFYKQLSTKKPPRGAEDASYQLVAKWTKRINIFEKKFIVVPINEHLHWYLAIIVNPGWILHPPKPKEVAPAAPARSSGRERKPSERAAAATTNSNPGSPVPTIDASASSSRQPSPVATTSKHFNKKNGAAPPPSAQLQPTADADGDADEDMLDADAAGDAEVEDAKAEQDAKKKQKDHEVAVRMKEGPGALDRDSDSDMIVEDDDSDVTMTGGRGVEGGGPSKKVVTSASHPPPTANEGYVADSQDEEAPDTQESAASMQGVEVLNLANDDDDEVSVQSPAKDKGKGKQKEPEQEGEDKMDVDPAPQDDRASSTTDSSSEQVEQALVPPTPAQAPRPASRPPTSKQPAAASSAPAKRQAVIIGPPTAPPEGSYSTPSASIEIQQPQPTPPAAAIDPAELEKCHILVFDSLDGEHKPVYGKLQYYLRHEALSKLGKQEGEIRPDEANAFKVDVPLQPNFCDCGLYLLHFVEKFLSDPDGMLTSILQIKAQRRSNKAAAKAQRAEQLKQIWDDQAAQAKRKVMREATDAQVKHFVETVEPAREQKRKDERRRKRTEKDEVEEREKLDPTELDRRPPPPQQQAPPTPSPPPPQAAPSAPRPDAVVKPSPAAPPTKGEGKGKAKAKAVAEELKLVESMTIDDDDDNDDEQSVGGFPNKGFTGMFPLPQRTLSPCAPSTVPPPPPRRATYGASQTPPPPIDSPDFEAPSNKADTPPRRLSPPPPIAAPTPADPPSTRTRNHPAGPTPETAPPSRTTRSNRTSGSRDPSDPPKPFSNEPSASKKKAKKQRAVGPKEDASALSNKADPYSMIEEEETGDIGTTQEQELVEEQDDSSVSPEPESRLKRTRALTSGAAEPESSPTSPPKKRSKRKVEPVAATIAAPVQQQGTITIEGLVSPVPAPTHEALIAGRSNHHRNPQHASASKSNGDLHPPSSSSTGKHTRFDQSDNSQAHHSSLSNVLGPTAADNDDDGEEDASNALAPPPSGQPASAQGGEEGEKKEEKKRKARRVVVTKEADIVVSDDD